MRAQTGLRGAVNAMPWRASAVKKSREQKKREKQQRLQGLRDRRWDHYDRILGPLGLAEGFRELPEGIREWIWRQRKPRPQVVLDPSAQALEGGADLRNELLRVFDQSALESIETISFTDLVTTVIPLVGCLSNLTTKDLSSPSAEYVKRAPQVIKQLVYPDLLGVVLRVVLEFMMAALGYSDFTRHVCWYQFNCVSPIPGTGERLDFALGGPIQALIGMQEIDQKSVIINGAARPVYRCGRSHTCGGFRWASLSAGDVGPRATRDQYPVYIQSHAVERLAARLGIDRQERDLAYVIMHNSLHHPRVVERRGADLWIECRWSGGRVGCLIGRILPDRVVVTTFLLITMEETPEGRLLKEKLGLQRPDVEYLRLNEIDALLTSDIWDDPTLVPLLEECGLGHLLRLRERHGLETTRSGLARELKAYLGIVPWNPGALAPPT
jgi:hypothetical protein